MSRFPKTENSVVLRTDFSDQAAWEDIGATIREPVGDEGFRAGVDFLDDAAFDGLSKEAVVKLIPRRYAHPIIVIVDRTTVASTGHPVLVIDLAEERGRDFRAFPSKVQSIENNLSLANMDFEEFADEVGEDGVFHGFPGE